MKISFLHQFPFTLLPPYLKNYNQSVPEESYSVPLNYDYANLVVWKLKN